MIVAQKGNCRSKLAGLALGASLSLMALSE